MFCSHQQLENVPVCERKINLPALKWHVAAVVSKASSEPTTKGRLHQRQVRVNLAVKTGNSVS
jgi:hypothetical protein